MADAGDSGSRPPDPTGPTQPIRPSQAGEPIPARVRQPIVVPRPERTIAGVPRTLAIAAAVGLLLALIGGFLVGRAVGGDDRTEEGSAARGGGCRKALSLSLQLVELQKQAIANRTEAGQALALGDDGRVQDLEAALQALAPVIQRAEADLAGAVERCQRRGGGDGEGGPRRGGRGERRGANGGG